MADATTARALEKEASTAQREGRFADAEKPLLAAIAIWTALRGPDDVEVLNDEMNLAVSYRRRGEAARAVPLLERVVQKLPASGDPDVPALLVTARNNLATTYRSLGRFALARKTWEACLVALDASPIDTPHPDRARVLDNLAVVLRDMRDFTASEARARRGLAEWRALVGEEHTDTATAKSAVGAALLEQDKLDDATPFLVEALRTQEKVGHELAISATLTLFGALVLKRGDRAGAREEFERALGLARKHLPDEHPEVRELLQSLRALG